MIGIPDRLLHLPGRHFIRVKQRSKRPVDIGWSKHPLPANDPKLQEHLQHGGNYGVVGGYGLVIADLDAEELKEVARQSLPETFTVESPGSQGWHLYYLCSLEDPVRLVDKNGENLGDIQGPGKQVVGPNSIHPNGKKYRIINDIPLAQITSEQLREAFKEYVVPKKQISQTYRVARKETARVDADLKIFDVVPIHNLTRHGDEWYGPHPIHGSTGGKNFWVNPSKNCWHCFRHQTGGGPLSFLAVAEGLIGCAEATPRALEGDKFKQVLQIAQEKGLIPTREDMLDVEPGEKPKPTAFTVDDTVNCRSLAEYLMKQNTFRTTNPAEIIYHYDPARGVYRDNGDLVVKEQVVDLLQDFCKEHYFKETKFIIQGETYFDPDQHLWRNEVCVENGILNVETGELSEHTKDKFITQQLPVKYDPNAECPKIKNFIVDVVGKEQVPLIQEFFGYCLYKEYSIDKSFMLIGDGANGKSTLLELLVRFLGKENVSSQSLQNICYNRFAAAELYRKLANVCADLPDKSLKATGLFKQLTGGDKLTVEKKYRDPFQFTNFAKLIFSANKIPETQDDTIAYFRRWIIITCNNYFPPSKANPNILDKISTPEELSGLLNWALKGLHRLLKKGCFSDNKTLEEYRQHYIRSSNSAKAFVEEQLEFTLEPDAIIPKSELYGLYVEWCREENLPAKRKAELTKTIHQYMPNIQDGVTTTKDREKVRAWYSLKVKGRNPKQETLS